MFSNRIKTRTFVCLTLSLVFETCRADSPGFWRISDETGPLLKCWIYRSGEEWALSWWVKLLEPTQTSHSAVEKHNGRNKADVTHFHWQLQCSSSLWAALGRRSRSSVCGENSKMETSSPPHYLFWKNVKAKTRNKSTATPVTLLHPRGTFLFSQLGAGMQISNH